LALYCLLGLISGSSLIALCHFSDKTRSYRFYSKLVAAMAIMTVAYAMMISAQSFWVYDLKNNVYNKDQSAALTYIQSNYFLPIPTVLYCLHNYDLMDRVSNHQPHKCTQYFRKSFILLICALQMLSTVVQGYLFDLYWVETDES
jgi:hypothetical protein